MENLLNAEAIMKFEELIEAVRDTRVHAPVEMKEERYVGKLKGYYIDNTKSFNIVYDEVIETRNDTSVVGEIFECKPNERSEKGIKPYLIGYWENDELIFEVDEEEVEIKNYYSLESDILSRNKGILESNVMMSKQAIIVGVGSGGSMIALELAKSGVGNFVLIDQDIFGYHNLSRHQCGVSDVGKYKVDAVKERILNINPKAQVITFSEKLQTVNPNTLNEIISPEAIILACGDNRHSAHVCNRLAEEYEVPMIAAGGGPRASTGEVFYYKTGMPCYECVFGPDQGEQTDGSSLRQKFYIGEEEKEKADFQPGLAVDIDWISIMVVKVAIDLLMEQDEHYEPRILNDISQYTMLQNYHVSDELNPMMKFYRKPMEWRRVKTAFSDECEMCNEFSISE